MNLKVFIGACVLSGLVACSSVKQDEAGLSRPGVGLELARFRKEHFSDVRYNLFFSIPESRDEAIRGKVELSLRLDEKQPLIIDFRGEQEQVTSVTLNGGDIPYEVKDEHIVIASDWVAVGENRVAIAFTPADQSLNRRDEFLYTLLVPDRARTVFPCFDQPDMKSLFTLTLEVPSTWQAVANSAITQTDSTGVSGRNRISFKETEPLSTYLFSFVAGELTREVYSRNGRDISIYHRETDPKKIAQCPAIADEVFDALEWQEDFTGIPYPFAKYDVIILPGFQYGGMEHTGATLYTDRRMFLDEHPTLNERLSRSALIAHETSHMWFGDYVTMKWFDDVWTKEVFANYFASRIVEPLYPDVNHRLNFIRDYIPASYSEDRTSGANRIKHPFGTYTPQPQKKAEPAPAPKAEPKELQSEAINPFDQAFSRPIATPDAGGFEGPKDNTIFGNFHASNNIRPASDVFATLNPQAGNGNDSGLWTANQHNGAPEAKGQGAAEAKAEDEKPRFEYGIPAFLRKKN